MAGGYLDVPVIQNMVTRSRNPIDHRFETPSSSPGPLKSGSLLEDRSWSFREHRRQISDQSAGSLSSHSRDESPPAPIFTYSRTEQQQQQQDNANHDLDQGIRESLLGVDLSNQHWESHPTGLPPGQLLSHGQEVISEEPLSEEYPDFRDSSLWLSQDALVLQLERGSTRRHGDDQADGSGQSPIYDMYGSRNSGDANRKVDQQHAGVTICSPGLPSPPPERERPEFSIARKPLPALPKDG